MNKLNSGSSNVKYICKSEDNLKLFYMAKYELGNSKLKKIIKTFKKGMYDNFDE